MGGRGKKGKAKERCNRPFRLYEFCKESHKMIFHQLSLGPMQNFIYLIGDEKSKEAAVVDAGWDVDKIIGTANKEKLTIKKIILTHSHFDHVQRVSELADKTKADVYFHELEYDSIKKHIKDDAIKIIKLKDNDEINVGKIKIKIIHTSGHAPGAICLHFTRK